MDITNENYATHITEFKEDIKRFENKFLIIEKDVVELECLYDQTKYGLGNRFSDLDEGFSNEMIELSKLSSFLTNNDYLTQKLYIKLTNYLNVLNQLPKFLQNMKTIIEDIRIIINSESNTIKGKDKIKGFVKENTAIVNPHLVHSRQTNHPFVLTVMHPGSRYQCNGCRGIIPLQIPYLKHDEEYPAGTKILRPHSYHITVECFHKRGFRADYLCRIKVILEEEISDDVHNALLLIGFSQKNIRMKDESANDSDSSETASNFSGVSADQQTNIYFIYRRKHINQKKKISCSECKEEIVTDSYVTLGSSFERALHIKKKCIQLCLPPSGDFTGVKCKVFKLLRNYGEVSQLIACGFHFKNIIGNKPPNPNLKARPQPPHPPKNAVSHSAKDVDFIFNNEPFLCERLLHGERCQGCASQIKKEEMSLRHKERVPRERLQDTPLVSQFYHVKKSCLIDRGFTDKYLELARCTVTLQGTDNMSEVRGALRLCGFSPNKLTFGRSEDGICESNSSSPAFEKMSNDSYLFVINCTKSLAQCEGCQLPISVNDTCFIYGPHPTQDYKARLFHINKACLSRHFTPVQILSMVCINSNSMVDIDPRDIIKCGIINIKTNLPNQFKKNSNFGVKQHPLQTRATRFVLDRSESSDNICGGCGQPLKLDKFLLRAVSNDDQPSTEMHLVADCVSKCGFPATRLAQLPVTPLTTVTLLVRQRLQECGFQVVPR